MTLEFSAREMEFSASEIRKILQQLFPHRRLVLSQFTFFNQIGVSKPTGESFRRGRRCYRLQDILSIACILALKEEGIPLKNIESVPALVQDHSEAIFSSSERCRLSGSGSSVTLLTGEEKPNLAIDTFLDGTSASAFFWSFDLGELARQLREIALQLTASDMHRAVA